MSLPVLMYHHVRPGGGFIAISPENFVSQMKALAESGWQTLDSNGIAAYYSGQSMPPKSLAITFDDGYLDNYLHAYPILRQYDMQALLFTVTGWLGDGRVRTLDASSTLPDHRACKAAIKNGQADDVMMRWSEIDEMMASGSVGIHSHTHTHTEWQLVTSNPAEKHQALASDLAQSKKSLETRLGRVSDHFCWPRGLYDDDDISTAAAAGFRYLYTTRRGVNRRHCMSISASGDASDQTVSIDRIDIKDKDGHWLISRLRLYTLPLVGDWYSRRRISDPQ